MQSAAKGAEAPSVASEDYQSQSRDQQKYSASWILIKYPTRWIILSGYVISQSFVVYSKLFSSKEN